MIPYFLLVDSNYMISEMETYYWQINETISDLRIWSKKNWKTRNDSTGRYENCTYKQ